MTSQEVVVRSAGGPFRQEVTVGPHRMVVDEPASVGGSDAGPSPYGMLLAALGSCTAMTLQMYARTKGWPLESVEVRLSHDKIHAKDCASCETKEGKLDRIEREVIVGGPLTDDQRKRLAEIADRCPVHRTLASEIHVHTRMTTPAA
jgi:uncharacterized OsmC-like protein